MKIVLLIFFLSPSLIFGQRIQALNHPNPSPAINLGWIGENLIGTAVQFEKMEIGIRPGMQATQKILNFINKKNLTFDSLKMIDPFDPDQITIKLNIYMDDQFVTSSDAFYIPQNFESNIFFNQQDSFYFPFRARIAIPYTIGNYKAEVTLKLKDGEQVSSSFPIQIISSNNKGFIEKGNQFRTMRYSKSKEQFIPILLTSSNQDDIAGLTIKSTPKIRDISFESPFNISGFYNLSEMTKHFWESLDNLDQRMEINNIDNEYYAISLFQLAAINIKENQIDSIIRFSDFLPKNATENSKLKNYMRYLVSRYGYSTKISEWHLFSGISLTENELTGIFNDWAEKQIIMIKRIENLPHLISMPLKISSKVKVDYLDLLPEIDILDITDVENLLNITNELKSFNLLENTNNDIIRYQFPAVSGEIIEKQTCHNFIMNPSSSVALPLFNYQNSKVYPSVLEKLINVFTKNINLEKEHFFSEFQNDSVHFLPPFWVDSSSVEINQGLWNTDCEFYKNSYLYRKNSTSKSYFGIFHFGEKNNKNRKTHSEFKFQFSDDDLMLKTNYNFQLFDLETGVEIESKIISINNQGILEQPIYFYHPPMNGQNNYFFVLKKLK